MTWGCFSKHGVGNLVIIDGKLTAVKYIEILQNNLFDSTQKMGLEREYVFQQDNDPKHKAKITTKFLEDNNITILDFPPQSPDLNPIEHLWDHLKRNVAITERTNKTIFINALYKEWNNISLDIIKKLIQSIPNRLRAVIAAKGYHTKY
ncbi:Transposable element Tcb1 transposase [Anthophora retusa]